MINTTDVKGWITQNHVTDNHIQMLLGVLFFMTLFRTCKTLLLKYAKIDPIILNELVSRINSYVHAVTVTYLSLKILFTDSELHMNKTLYRSQDISMTLNIVIGYMLVDLFLILYYEEMKDPEHVMHHIVSITAFYACSMIGIFPFIALSRLASEASTPFVNKRWFMLKFDMKYSRWYLINLIIIVATFSVVRVISIVPIWLVFITEMSTPQWRSISWPYRAICICASLPLDCLNLYWYRLLLRSFKKHLGERGIIREKKEEAAKSQ